MLVVVVFSSVVVKTLKCKVPTHSCLPTLLWLGFYQGTRQLHYREETNNNIVIIVTTRGPLSSSLLKAAKENLFCFVLPTQNCLLRLDGCRAMQ